MYLNTKKADTANKAVWLSLLTPEQDDGTPEVGSLSGFVPKILTKNDIAKPQVQYSEDGKTIQGFYLNGKVYLVRDGIAKGQTMPVLMHELGEHAAQLGFANDAKYRAILQSLENRKDEKSANGEAIRAAMQRARLWARTMREARPCC